MRIGELARITGVSTRALRFYEENGLLGSERLSNGYRDYPETAVARVRNIRRLLDHGLTLEDVAHFRCCLDGDVMSANPDPALVAVAERRLAVLDERIDALVQVRDQLAQALTSGR
ncbi:MerR family transcriptional regulator [Saccharothrix variisporea]|uniref:DNA-binding transcriptional MerR regulator n=1 Tax=Saccharothrix variisporea TaxID=543527 RepID=A0A495XA23_9PSEU|nr:MerR family transcriptional regulator [Saccharothrix variisporea]RKT69694.1 DNA-binding transcriptional MerR regulator [Saccharothrix variisporea]